MSHRARSARLLVALAVVAGAALTLSEGALGATVNDASSSARWGASQVLDGTGPQSEPARWPVTNRPSVLGTETQEESTNWSGLIDTGGPFTQVSARWIVPAVSPSSSTKYSSTWIGIDGVTDTSLIQAGTEQDTSGSYYAWYEILPSAAIALGAVSPGDQMAASITEDAPDTWTIVVSDQTSGNHASVAVSYSGPATSAEWIEEAPSNQANQVQPLADFGTASFSDMEANAAPVDIAALTPVVMANAGGTVIAYPASYGTASFSIAYGSPSDQGYWLVGADGGIFAFGSAQFYGSTGSMQLQRPVVGITPTADRDGYWLVAADGGTFAFGDAGFYGSIPGLGIAPAGTAGNVKKLNAPIVGVVPSIDGGGYFMVGSDGGVFAFGDAHFAGSCPAIGGCAGAAVAVMPDASGNGYWLVTTTGDVYAFGDATYYGAPGPQTVPVTSAVRTPDGRGYWILFSNGAVAAYGDATGLGGPVGAVGGANPASAIVATADGAGYWVASANGTVYPLGDAIYDGGMAGQHLNAPIIAAAGW